MAVAVVGAAATVVAGLEVAATPGLEVAGAASDLEGAQVASGLVVVAVPGSSLDVAVAARSEVVAGFEVAGAAAAASLASGLPTTGTMTTGTGGPAAHPGERAAYAKSHDLTAISSRATRFDLSTRSPTTRTAVATLAEERALYWRF